MYVCVYFIVAVYMHFYALSTPMNILCILPNAGKGPWLGNKKYSILFYALIWNSARVHHGHWRLRTVHTRVMKMYTYKGDHLMWG